MHNVISRCTQKLTNVVYLQSLTKLSASLKDNTCVLKLTSNWQEFVPYLH